MNNQSRYSNFDYLNEVNKFLIDPLGKEILKDVKWINLGKEWDNSNFPVVIGGKGDPILLLHGFDSCFLEFRRIYPILKNHFNIIIPDLFGFGFSTRLSNKEYNSQIIITHLIDLLKELNLKRKFKVIGASMGGSVALTLSNNISTQIDKTVLLSPAGLFGEPQNIPKPLNQLGAAFLGLPYIRKKLCRQAFAFPDKSVGEAEEQIASIHLGCLNWRNSLASFAKNGGFGGTLKYLQDIPTKTICGDNDRILGIKELNKLKQISKLNFLGLKNCGHLPHLDLPQLTGKIIYDYFI